ncbi:peptidase S1, partial [Clostridioides difficile]|nr:peptidase S1 [Clostridioides difficile]
MYDEDESKDTGRMNPEEHKEEAVTTNFIMRDPDLEKSSTQDSESSSQTQSQTHSSYEAQQNIPHYQEYQYHRAAGQNAFQEEAMPKKKGGFAK